MLRSIAARSIPAFRASRAPIAVRVVTAVQPHSSIPFYAKASVTNDFFPPKTARERSWHERWNDALVSLASGHPPSYTVLPSRATLPLATVPLAPPSRSIPNPLSDRRTAVLPAAVHAFRSPDRSKLGEVQR
jgi:hypothetical protein